MLPMVWRFVMADIAKCNRDDCPKCKTCFRFLATPSQYQSFFIIDEVDENCKEYWECTTEEEFKRLDYAWRD